MIKWDEIIFLRIGNETEDEMIDEKFSRASKGNMSFPFYAPNGENEIEEEDKRWGVVM